MSVDDNRTKIAAAIADLFTQTGRGTEEVADFLIVLGTFYEGMLSDAPSHVAAAIRVQVQKDVAQSSEVMRSLIRMGRQ